MTWGVTVETSFFWGSPKTRLGSFSLDQPKGQAGWLKGQAGGGQGPQRSGARVGARGHSSEERKNEGVKEEGEE